jgi:DNA (cytosine-5)-methyltransferase 1
MWFVKARRAQNENDFETWIEGGVSTTLNAFDNATETRATVLIMDGTRVGDVRLYEDTVMQTVIQRWGTRGGNVPAIAYSIREDAKAGNFSATETDTALTLQSYQPSVQAHHAQLFIADAPSVRRLTPRECERLQGFPDGWTEDQADSHRYKQLGNAVAVPVVQWIIDRI